MLLLFSRGVSVIPPSCSFFSPFPTFSASLLPSHLSSASRARGRRDDRTALASSAQSRCAIQLRFLGILSILMHFSGTPKPRSLSANTPEPSDRAGWNGHITFRWCLLACWHVRPRPSHGPCSWRCPARVGKELTSKSSGEVVQRVSSGEVVQRVLSGFIVNKRIRPAFNMA